MKHVTEEMNLLLKRTGSLDEEEARCAMQELAHVINPIIRIAIMEHCVKNDIYFEQVINLEGCKILELHTEWLRIYSVETRWDVILEFFRRLEASIIKKIEETKPDCVLWPSIVIADNSTQTRGILVMFGVK